MNNNCEFVGKGYCMCSTCQAVREAMKEAEKVTKEDVDKLFCDAEKLLKDIMVQEEEDKKDGRNMEEERIC